MRSMQVLVMPTHPDLFQIALTGGGGDFAQGIFRTRKFRAGFISHSGLKIEREISHLPGLSTVRASVPGGPSLVKKKTITRSLHSDLKPKVCVFSFGSLCGIYATHNHDLSRVM